MAITFAECKEGYKNLWETMQITRETEVEKAARKIILLRARYEIVEKQTGVPWYMIGVLHMRESGNDFAGVLHNGEKIIGTGRKTRLEPRGRGPFMSWEEAAVDALKIKQLDQNIDWTIERILWECERFNGLGYFSRGVNSPYIWAGSNHYTKGKYIADGRYSSSKVDPQLGCAPVLKRIFEIAYAKQVPGSSSQLTTRLGKWVGIAGGGLATVVNQVTPFITDWRTVTVACAALVIAGVWFWRLEHQKLQEYRQGRYIPSGDFKDPVPNGVA